MSELEPTRTYSNPTATDELRRLLDERGVEWDKGKLAMLDDEYTHWWVTERMEGFVAYECDYPLDTLIVRGITPEQAIAATLGPVTCRIENRNGDWYCTGCGEMVGTCDTASELCIDGNAIGLWNYCCNCGRKVVGE